MGWVTIVVTAIATAGAQFLPLIPAPYAPLVGAAIAGIGAALAYLQQSPLRR